MEMTNNARTAPSYLAVVPALPIRPAYSHASARCCQTRPSTLPIVCGTSAGAINAATTLVGLPLRRCRDLERRLAQHARATFTEATRAGIATRGSLAPR